MTRSRHVITVCVPVDADGSIGPRWGRADRVAIAEVDAGQVVSWAEIEVSWGTLHDEGTEGEHHARVVRFLREHDVGTVVAGHMGEGMRQTLAKMGLQVRLGFTGDARAAVQAVRD
jgi:predicted Fe-Mo cluster-binding NifX family protein